MISENGNKLYGTVSSGTTLNGNASSSGGTRGKLSQTLIAGVPGDDGDDGATFTPSVSTDGTLSWTNDKDLPNPPSVNIKGKDGYTPQKNVDYFDGKDGYTPIKGKDYFDGEDGTPCTHRWSGTTLYVTSASGTSSANLKGEPGDDGYTPKKGVDYYTDADKAEMVNAVIAALPKYNGEVTSV